MLTPIKTVEDLRDYIKSITGEVFTDKELIWLNCMYQASSMFDSSSTKDIANVLLEGIKPINQLSDVQDLLDTVYADLDDTTEATLYLQQYVAIHIGNHTLARQLQEQLEEYQANQ